MYDITDNTRDNIGITKGVKSAIANMEGLRCLDIRDVLLGTNGRFLFEDFPCSDLRVLSFYDTQLSCSGTALLSSLSNLPSLSYLDLFNSGFSQEEMTNVIQALPSSCPGIIFLDISDIKFTSSSLKPVSALRKLKSLGFLPECAGDLLQTLDYLPSNVELLYIRHFGNISQRLNSLISVLRSHVKLRYLVINDGEMDRRNEEKLESGLRRSRVRLVNSDTDPEGLDEYQSRLGTLLEQCISGS